MTPSLRIPLAHQGGWDEILLFVSVPVLWLLILAIGRLIRRRRGGDGADR